MCNNNKSKVWIHSSTPLLITACQPSLSSSSSSSKPKKSASTKSSSTVPSNLPNYQAISSPVKTHVSNADSVTTLSTFPPSDCRDCQRNVSYDLERARNPDAEIEVPEGSRVRRILSELGHGIVFCMEIFYLCSLGAVLIIAFATLIFLVSIWLGKDWFSQVN